MDLEPRLIDSIKRNRRNAAWQKFLVLQPFLYAVVAALVTSIIMGVLGLATFYIPASAFESATTGVFLIALLPLPIFAILFAFHAFDTPRRARRLFEVSLAKRFEPPSREVRVYEDALEGLGIATNTSAPALAFLDYAIPNALAFEDLDGEKRIGVTRGLLSTDVSVSEATAVMAHEYSHIIISDDVKPPRLRDLEFLPSILTAVFTVLGNGRLCSGASQPSPAGLSRTRRPAGGTTCPISESTGSFAPRASGVPRSALTGSS